jgi:phospholipid transport system substrate-binding protein
MKRRIFLLLALASPVAALADTPPAAPIEALNQGLLSIMHAGSSTPFAARVETLTPIVERTFDLPLILQRIIGQRWSGLSDEQRQNLLAAFTAFTVANWVANFDSYDGEKFEIAPDTRKVSTDEVVQTRIIPTSGDPTRLDYVMRHVDGAWKAVDILLNGSISRVAVQRSDFRSQIASGDPSMLITMLRDKTNALASGDKS